MNIGDLERIGKALIDYWFEKIKEREKELEEESKRIMEEFNKDGVAMKRG